MATVTADRAPHPESSRRRHLTVMFCDVVGSTRLSRGRDVESYFSVLRAYYDACGPVVERHGGFIAQHHGDGIYVWFGYPEPHEDDGVRAVRAGLDLLVVLGHLSARLEAEAGEPLAVRIAVHAGEVLMAPVGNEPGPLAFGHTPNLAAKLQQAARPGTMVVSADLLRAVEDAFDVRKLPDAVLPDGTRVPVYEIVGERQPAELVARQWRTPLVGRERELDRLRRSWSAVRAGAGRTVVVTGGRGVGKTRLVSSLAAAEAAHAAVVDCACHELDAGSAYGSIRKLLARAAGIKPDDPPALQAARLRDHLGELEMDQTAAVLFAAVLGLPAETVGKPPDLDPSKLAQLTVELLVRWAARLAAARPTLMLVDDLDHADPSSLAVLQQLASGPPPGLLLILTTQAEVTPLADLAGEHAEIVRVEPFAAAAARALIDAVTEAAPLAPHVREEILVQCEGVPLYLEELTRAADDDADHATVPTGLTGRLQARLSAPDVDAEVRGALAVANRATDESTLAAVLGVEAAEVRRRLTGLLARDLVTDLGPGYQFRHGLLRDAAYGLLLQEQRVALHGLMADTLIAQRATGGRADWNVLGRHLELARRPLDAYEALLAGADEARRAGAVPEALQSYGEALDLVAAIADPEVRSLLEVRARLQRGVTAVSARGFGADEAVEDFDRCAELCRRLGPRPEHLSAMTGVYSFYLLQGDLAAARRVAEDLRAWVESAHAERRPENLLAFGVLSFFEGDYRGAVEALSDASARFAFQPPGTAPERNWLLPLDPFVATLSHLSSVLWIVGRQDEALEAGDRAMARAALLPFPTHPFSMAYAKSYLSWTHAVAGNHESAARLAAQVCEIGTRHGFAFWECTGQIHLALAEYRTRGRADAADTVAANASIWELLRARVFLPYVLTTAAQMRTAMGQADLAAAGFETAGRLAEETGVRFYEAERLRLQAHGLAAAGAADVLRRAGRLASRQGALLFELRAALDLARLDGTAESAGPLRDVVARFPSTGGYPELNEARAVLSRAAART